MGIKFKHKSVKSLESVKYAPSKRKLAKWQWYLLSLILISPILLYIINHIYNMAFPKANGFITYDEINIRSPIDGHVDKIFLKEAKNALKGEKLILLSSSIATDKIIFLENEIKYIQSILDKAKEIRASYLLKLKKEAMEDLKKSEEYFEIFRTLRKKGIVSIINEDDAWDELRIARQRINQIQYDIAMHENNFNIQSDNDYSKNIRDMSHELKKLIDLENRHKLSSPINAKVGEIYVSQYEYVRKGQPLIKLITNNNLHFKVFVDPKYISRIHKGKIVKIIFPDGNSIKAKIYNKPFMAKKTDDNKNYILGNKAKIITLIKPVSMVPSQYNVYRLPVEVRL